jgi:CRP-like cAMP-binding protein
MLPAQVKRPVVEDAAVLRLAKGEMLVATAGSTDGYVRVSSGLVAVELSMADGRRQILAFHRPGDGFALFPDDQLPGMRARAIVASSLQRCPPTPAPVTCRCPLASVGDVRQSSAIRDLLMHLTMLGRLTAEERVATFLLRHMRIALRPNASLMLPMTRRDIADYLGLNPDTLSRVLSRFEEGGLIKLRRRSDVVIRDQPALEAMSPFAAASNQSRI